MIEKMDVIRMAMTSARNLLHYLEKLRKRAEAAEARLATLKDYTVHKPTCAALPRWELRAEDASLCDCGLATALRGDQQAATTERGEGGGHPLLGGPPMSDERLRDMQTDIIMLWERGKVIAITPEDVGFSVAILARDEFESWEIWANWAVRPKRCTGKTIEEAIRRARQSVEGGPA
jgi:hypothetical protein